MTVHLNLMVPARPGVVWTAELATSAVGKPFVDLNGRPLGKVAKASIWDDGALLLDIEIPSVSVEANIATDELLQVSLAPAPPAVAEDAFVTSLRDVGHARLDEVEFADNAAEEKAHDVLDELLDSVSSYISLHEKTAE